ncbi:MAG: RIP metalloprotease RseP [bacterium]
MSFLYFILVFFLVVNVHELGHFIAAKISKVGVEEYGFGWPPRLFSKVIKGTRYSLNLILAGGFVKLFGKDPEEQKALTSPQSFQTKSFAKKLLIILGGILCNLLLAFVVFYFLFLTGFPRLSGYNSQNVYIHNVTKNSPAEEGGIKVGDNIISIGGLKVNDYTKMGDTVEQFSGKEVTIVLERGEELINLKVVPAPLLGVSVNPVPLEKAGVFGAAGLAFREVGRVCWEVGSVFYKFIIGQREGIEISGPVGIAEYSKQSAQMGMSYFWQFVATLSVNLAVLNLIPFPALDGGWAALAIFEKIRGKRVSTKVQNIANTLGFVVIIALLILVTLRDIFH